MGLPPDLAFRTKGRLAIAGIQWGCQFRAALRCCVTSDPISPDASA
jgi:hypothetical protein